MILGTRYEDKKNKSQEEQQITPSIFQNISPSIVFLKTDIEDDNFTLSSIVFQTDGP